jgi:uncharacterized protein (UPF0261 family)
VLNVIAVISVSLATVLAGAVIFGARRWESETRELRARLDAARLPVRPKTVDFRELQSLPAPVQRFFRMAVKEGQPLADAALFDALRRHVKTPPVDLVELDLHINDPEFADALADRLLAALAQESQ